MQGLPCPFSGMGHVSAQALAPVWRLVSHWAGLGHRVLPSRPSAHLVVSPDVTGHFSVFSSRDGGITSCPFSTSHLPLRPQDRRFHQPKKSQIFPQSLESFFFSLLSRKALRGPQWPLWTVLLSPGVSLALPQAVVWELHGSRAPKSSSRAPRAARGSAARTARAAEDV